MEPASTYHLNQNIADCLRDVQNIGSKTVVNICTGTETVVPWGVGDWVLGGVLGGFVAVASVMLLALALMILTDR